MSLIGRRVNGGGAYGNGRLNEVFPQARSGDPTDYQWVELFNSGPEDIPATKVWLTLDPAGAAVTLAVADPAAQAGSYVYVIDPTSLTYTAPTSKVTGLDAPALLAGQKCLFTLRRVLAGAAAVSPETNRLNVST